MDRSERQKKHKLNLDEETNIHKNSRSRRCQKKYKKNANHRQRRKAKNQRFEFRNGHCEEF